MGMVKCKNCECWQKHEKVEVGREIGNCRRHPPLPMLIPTQGPTVELAESLSLAHLTESKVNMPKVGLGMNFFFPMTGAEIECGDGIPKR
jgi:hypothetical protein